MVEEIINKYYADNQPLKEILLRHSQSVAEKALKVAERHPELCADKTFLQQAAMLHDIGIFLTDAPGIQCFGTEPYIRHGLLGAEILRSEGFPRHARVAERHTGTGLSRKAIITQQLPLPAEDFLPETIEEQIICYADKYFSKSHLERVRTDEQVLLSLQRFGKESVDRMTAWMNLFG
ncbi:MAG: HDIG domain-containing protein [Bacteroidaceae bacterium]|nr:HDIG domain-containing protein [Bacteroidaceae bacterium]